MLRNRFGNPRCLGSFLHVLRVSNTSVVIKEKQILLFEQPPRVILFIYAATNK